MRLLIIEDEPTIQSFLKQSFEAEMFAVDTSSDGAQGAALAIENNYDIIVLDNILPRKTGLQICKEIRENGKATPILVLSVKADTDMKVLLLNAGADDYLIKPFSFNELLARIRALLRRPKNVDKEVLSVDDLVLDTKAHKMTRGGKEIYLTRKEFMLLEYLMHNRGTVLSRSMIMEHVWDMNADPFSNTIEAHINILRKKIDTRGKKKLIHTIPSIGYVLDTKVIKRY